MPPSDNEDFHGFSFLNRNIYMQSFLYILYYFMSIQRYSAQLKLSVLGINTRLSRHITSPVTSFN